jgi:hypothetical protein
MSVLLPSKPIGLNIDVNEGSSIQKNVLIDDTGLFIIDDDSTDTSIVLKTNNIPAFLITDTQRIGINISNPTSRLVINDEFGDCIKLSYNQLKFANIRINSNGSLQFETFDNVPINFVSGDTNTSGLKLNGVLLESTAEKLNYTNIDSIGIAEAEKVLVLDSSKSISGINYLSVNNLIINSTLALNTNSTNFAFVIQNNLGNCLKLKNDNEFATFSVLDSGVLSIYNTVNTIEILSDNNNSIIYPLQLTTANNLINTGIGIKFNTYNDNNIKRNMSTIETIITNNENNRENSIIRFNNMNNGDLLNTVTIRNDGYILCNTLMELSDSRAKRIINKSDYKDSLKKINEIKTYDFVYIEDLKETIHKGVMAQELHEVIPSAVNIGEHYTISNKELIGYLIDCVKSLSQSICEIKSMM